MKKIYFLGLAVSAGLVFYSFQSKKGGFNKYHADGVYAVTSSSNPPAARTGAPGEGNCTACHSGAVQSAAGTINYSFSDTDYLPGQTYDITLSIASGAKNGFQMTILDDSGNKAGNFTAGTGSGVTTSGARQYIRQTSATGVTSWTFQWTAPDTDMGDLTAYYSFNKSNANGSTSGDVIYLGQETIPVSAFAKTSNYEKINQDITVSYSASNEVLVNYRLPHASHVRVQLIGLNGQLLQNIDLGMQEKGKQEIVLNALEDLQGVFIVALFQDNLVFNRKVLIP